MADFATTYQRTVHKKKLYGCSTGDEEIIFQEVLPRLPTKSLCRFKSVCKKWLNLLAHDGVFFAHHSRKGPNRTSTTGFFSIKSEVFFSSDGQYSRCMRPKGITMGSTNGLIYGVRCDNGDLNQIFICNPITNHTIHVPNPTNEMSLLALAWDPYNPTFGFTLVHPLYLPKEKVYQFRVYSSQTGEWRVSKNASAFGAPGSCHMFAMRPAVYAGEKVYWYVTRPEVILWFDIEKEVAGLLEYPNNFVLQNINLHENIRMDFLFHFLSKDITFSKIGECEGKLSYVAMTKEGDLEAWLLMEKNNELEWVKKHTVRLRRIFEQNREVLLGSCNGQNIGEVVEAVALWRRVRPLPYSGGEFVWFLVITSLKVFSFNLTTQELKLINKDVMIKPPLYPFMPTILPCPT